MEGYEIAGASMPAEKKARELEKSGKKSYWVIIFVILLLFLLLRCSPAVHAAETEIPDVTVNLNIPGIRLYLSAEPDAEIFFKGGYRIIQAKDWVIQKVPIKDLPPGWKRFSKKVKKGETVPIFVQAITSEGDVAFLFAYPADDALFDACSEEE